MEMEEEYINMEITSFSSSPQSKDFEFQHLSTSSSSSAAAASDLFYRGKLLPLPLHIRPPPSLSAPCTTSNTPSDSRNISPSQSCRPSCDLNPTDITSFFFLNNNNPPRNHSWSKMNKLNKRSYLVHKLKSSRVFLKSLFNIKDSSSKVDPTSFFGKKCAILTNKNGIDDHRRSFSGVIASDSSSSSTSSSFNSSALHEVEVQYVRRSSSATEIEVSIDAAIAHCKKSFATN